MKKMLLLLLFSMTANSVLKAQTHIGDSLALVALYNSTNGPEWSDATNWLQPGIPASDWDYVYFNGEGRVIRLQLGMNNMSGILPPEIGNLTMLRTFDVQNNDISGTVPVEIGNLVNLEYLILYSNEFSGSIPVGISNLTNLIALSLADNHFTGQLPAMGNLSNLESFACHENEFTGPLPAELGTFSHLEELSIFINNFTGPMPEGLADIPALKNFALGDNCFTFSDFEQFVGNSLDYFGYWPQRQIKTITHQLNFATGDTIEFDITQLTKYESAATNNEYRCLKDGGTLISDYSPSPVVGTTELDNADEGFYYFTMINSDWPGFVLITDSIKLVIDGPVDLQLSNDSIDENVNPGTLIGTLIVSDPDQVDGHVLSFVEGEFGSGVDNEFFTLNGEQLTINVSPDFETKLEYNICIRAIDNEDQNLDKAFTIIVNDLADGTGIKAESGRNFRVFPNPVQDQITIEYVLLRQDEITVRLLDMRGGLIATINSREKQQPGSYIKQINLPGNLSHGIYIVSVSGNTTQFIQKIIK